MSYFWNRVFSYLWNKFRKVCWGYIMDNLVESIRTRLKEFSYLFLEHHFLYILLKWESSIYYLHFLILIHSSKHCSLVSIHICSLTTLTVAAYLLNSNDIFHLGTFLLHLPLFLIHSLILEFYFLGFHDDISFWFFFYLLTILFLFLYVGISSSVHGISVTFLRVKSFIYCSHHFILSLFFHIWPISWWVLTPIYSPGLFL